MKITRNLYRCSTITWVVYSFVLMGTLSSCISRKYLSDLKTDYSLQPGLLKGYLTLQELPSSLALLSPPPDEGSVAFQLDEEITRKYLTPVDSLRWDQAVKDSDLEFPEAISSFVAIVQIPIDEKNTPYLYLLLQRSLTDAILSTYSAKNFYKRVRPFMINEGSTCTPYAEAHMNDGSYPSGHAAVGWAWALILSELFPRETNKLIDRGRAFGDSRVVCNVHWQSDVEAGRFMGAATVARLHANPNFRADLEKARKEVSEQSRK
jgi:acid phosphatase (class A)